MTGSAEADARERPRFLRLHLTNFLSYREAVLEFDDLLALVGPNASGKSNAIAALKLLRDLATYPIPMAISRRGGFEQLRHCSGGTAHDPALRLEFQYEGQSESYYELKLTGTGDNRFELRSEEAVFDSRRDRTIISKLGDTLRTSIGTEEEYVITGISSALASAHHRLSMMLHSIQTVEINPARIGELQEPSSVAEFESDGSNAASIFENLDPRGRKELVDELSAIVPGIERIEVLHLADRVTLAFHQGGQEFLAKQMSDGTLRAFGILLAMLQPQRPALLVIEEPEIAIHLGALRTLVDILRQQSAHSQVLITTHSADVVDTIEPDSLRVVWSEDGASRISRVAPHTLEPVRRGLITPGELLRSDSLDPATT